MGLFPLLWAAKPRGSIPHVINSIKTKSDGQALRVSLVKLVVYLSTNYERFKTKAEAKLSIIDYLAFYNGKRKHSKLGYLSPLDFECDFFKGIANLV